MAVSLQAGFVSFDDRPVPLEAVASIGQYLEQLGVDRGGEFVAPGVAMVSRASTATTGALDDGKPLISASGLVMTWDGRLDNREDLRLQLGREVDTSMTDGALALAVYDKWRDDGFRHLVGDWSLAVWDAARRQLTLASDYAGIRGLYFCCVGSILHWSSSLAELVDRCDTRAALDSSFVIGYVTSALPQDVTPYRNVYSVSPAHAITWRRTGQALKQRFWTLPTDTVRLQDERDYAVCLGALFAAAVKNRLYGAQPVWAELSGGFDSSAIVCMADHLRVSGQTSAAPVETISYITDASPESDERRFVGVVERHRGRQGRYVKTEEHVTLTDSRWGWVTPFHPNGTRLRILQTVADAGGRVLLTGNPGDLVMANFPQSMDGIFEHLSSGHLMRAMTLLYRWCRVSGHPIWHGLSRIAGTASAAGRTRRLLAELPSRFGYDSGSLTARAAAAFHLTNMAATRWLEMARADAQRRLTVSRRGRETLSMGVQEVTSTRLLQTLAEACGVVRSHPYMDRPLVEFMLSIPGHVATRPGEPRRLMKAAFADQLLPDRISRRTSKGYAPPLIARKLKVLMPADLSAIDTFYVVQTACIDGKRLRRALESVRDGSCRNVANLERVLMLEDWIASRDRLPRAS